MFIVPHGAPEGYEWFVALVVLPLFRRSQLRAGAALMATMNKSLAQINKSPDVT
jgi:hypothetical protein